MALHGSDVIYQALDGERAAVSALGEISAN